MTASESSTTEAVKYTQLSTYAGHDVGANPIYYVCPCDGREYLILAKKREIGLLFYDILKNSFEEKFKYPTMIQTLDFFSPSYAALDREKDTLYIFAFWKNVCIFNLSTGKYDLPK